MTANQPGTGDKIAVGTQMDGNRVRDAILAECLPRVAAVRERCGRPPGLAVILAGDNPASEVYVRNKIRACGELGIFSETLKPAEGVTTGELVEMVEALNARAEIDGILVQLPLPKGVDAQKVLLTVNAARMWMAFIRAISVGWRLGGWGRKRALRRGLWSYCGGMRFRSRGRTR